MSHLSWDNPSEQDGKRVGWDHMKWNIRKGNTEEKKEGWRGEEGRDVKRRLRGEKSEGGERRIFPSFIFP